MLSGVFQKLRLSDQRFLRDRVNGPANVSPLAELDFDGTQPIARRFGARYELVEAVDHLGVLGHEVVSNVLNKAVHLTAQTSPVKRFTVVKYALVAVNGAQNRALALEA